SSPSAPWSTTAPTAAPGGQTAQLSVWTEPDDGKDTPRDLTAAGGDHQGHLGADLPQEPHAGPWIFRIRRPVDQVHRRDDMAGNAHAHRPGRGVRHDRAATPGGEA